MNPTSAHYSMQNSHQFFCTHETKHVGISVGTPLLVEHTFYTPTLCRVMHWVLEGIIIVFLSPLSKKNSEEMFTDFVFEERETLI